MLNAQPLPAMSPETKELTVPPTSGLAPTLRLDDLKLPTTVEQCVPSMQPLVQFESQLLALLSDIDATPSPVASPITQQSVDASPLTERAIRYHRRDAFRTDRNNVAPVSSPSSTDPPHTLGAKIHETDRSDSTPAPQRKLIHFTIPNPIPSLNHDQYRSPSFDSLPRMHPEFNTPATFPRATRAPYMTEQRSLSAGLRSLPRVPSPPASSRALRRMSTSSTTSSASAAKSAAAGSRPSTSGTAHARPAAPFGHPQGTSSPVASSTLREISGYGTARTRGLRPDSPVPSRISLGGPHGPPAPPTHLSYLNEVWDTMEPALRARLGSVTLQDAETSLERARATAPGEGPGRTAADACAFSLAEEEYASVLQPLQARAASLTREHADLSGRLHLNMTQQRSTAADMTSAERHHLRSPPPSEQAPNSHPPPAPRRAQRPPSPSPLPLPQRVLPALQLPRRLGALCPRRHHRPPACRSPPQPRGQLLLRAAPGSLHHPPAMTDIWTSVSQGSCTSIAFPPQRCANPSGLWPPKWRQP